ncbi:hypothetical protein ROZALSC1DRAFT_25915 [Rozella allomycis CSF55]|uniref:Uncharacterized protein n=1 Tax=Rozella allomycis (strain CSF55) TaxID=988480 RepID=A0A4P9Y9N2_ROZAC|nr:hypothetical protein ROZALSC1DRAFT_25915 [Rozella allomycis CSF55]
MLWKIWLMGNLVNLANAVKRKAVVSSTNTELPVDHVEINSFANDEKSPRLKQLVDSYYLRDCSASCLIVDRIKNIDAYHFYTEVVEDGAFKRFGIFSTPQTVGSVFDFYAPSAIEKYLMSEKCLEHK